MTLNEFAIASTESATNYVHCGSNFIVNRYVDFLDTKEHENAQDYLWVINDNFPKNFVSDEEWQIRAYNIQLKTDFSVLDELTHSTGWNLDAAYSIENQSLRFYSTEINESTNYAWKVYNVPYYNSYAVSSIKLQWDSCRVSSKAWNKTTTLMAENWTCTEPHYVVGHNNSSNLIDTQSDDGQTFEVVSESVDMATLVGEKLNATKYDTYALTIDERTVNATELKDNIWFGGYHVSSLNNWFGTLYLYFNASQFSSINRSDVARVIVGYKVSYCSGGSPNLGGDFSVYDYTSSRWVAISEKGDKLEGTWVGDNRYVAQNGELKFRITTYLVRCREYGYTQEQCIHYAKCDWLQINITRYNQCINVTFPFKTQLSRQHVNRIRLFFNAWHDPIDKGEISIYNWDSGLWTVLISNFEEIDCSDEFVHMWETTDLCYISNDENGEIRLNYYIFKNISNGVMLYIDYHTVRIDYEEIVWNISGSGAEVCSVESLYDSQGYTTNVFHDDGSGENRVWTTYSIDLTSHKDKILGSTILIRYGATHKGGGDNDHTPISDFRIDNIRLTIAIDRAYAIQGARSIDLTDGLWHTLTGNVENVTLCGCIFTAEIRGRLKDSYASLEHLMMVTNGSNVVHNIRILCAPPSGGKAYSNFRVKIVGIPLSYRLVNVVSVRSATEVTSLCSFIDGVLEIPNIVIATYEYGEYLLTLTSDNRIVQCYTSCCEEEIQTLFQHGSKVYTIWTASDGNNYYHEGNYTYRVLNFEGKIVFEETDFITSTNACSTRPWLIPELAQFGEYTCEVFWSDGLEGGIFARKVAITALNITDIKILQDNGIESTWFNVNSSTSIRVKMVYAHTGAAVKNGKAFLDLGNGTLLSCETNGQGYCIFNVNWTGKSSIYNLTAFGGEEYHGITEKAENKTLLCTVTSLLCDDLRYSKDFMNVNESTVIQVHLVYAHDRSSVVGGVIAIENETRVTNSSGWAVFSATKNVAGNYQFTFYAIQDATGGITKSVLNQTHEFVWTGLLLEKISVGNTNSKEADVILKITWAHNSSVAKNVKAEVAGLNLSALTDENGLVRITIKDDDLDTSGIFSIEAYGEHGIRSCFNKPHIKIKRLYVATEIEGSQTSALIKFNFFYDSNSSEIAEDIYAKIGFNGYVRDYVTNRKGEITISNLCLMPGNFTYEFLDVHDLSSFWICNEKYARETLGHLVVGAIFDEMSVPSSFVDPVLINGSLTIRSLCDRIKLNHLRLQINLFDEYGERVRKEILPIMDELCPNETRKYIFEITNGIEDLHVGKYTLKFYLYYGSPERILAETKTEIILQCTYGPYDVQIIKGPESLGATGLEKHEVAVHVINKNPLRKDEITLTYLVKNPSGLIIYNGSERLNLPSNGECVLILGDKIFLNEEGNYTMHAYCLHGGENAAAAIMTFYVKKDENNLIHLWIWLVPSSVIAMILLFLKSKKKQIR